MITTEIYAKFSLRRLKIDFSLLVSHTKSPQISEMRYEKKGYKSPSHPLDKILSGVIES